MDAYLPGGFGIGVRRKKIRSPLALPHTDISDITETLLR
jgi:hypothetical protein